MNFYRAQYAEQGDFVNLGYMAETVATDDEVNIHMQRGGHVWVNTPNGALHADLRVTKTFTVHRGDSALRVLYTITSTATVPLDLRFGVETVIGFDGGQDLDYCALRVGSDPMRRSLTAIAATDHVRDYRADSKTAPCWIDHVAQYSGVIVAISTGDGHLVGSRLRARLSGHSLSESVGNSSGSRPNLVSRDHPNGHCGRQSIMSYAESGRRVCA